MEKVRLDEATKASVKMEKDRLSTNKAIASSHSLMEIKEKATRALVKMEKDRSSRSKARASSHSLDIMEKATEASVKMEKDRSSTSKARASSHSLMEIKEIKEKARLGEATRALVKMKKEGSSASKARAGSQFSFGMMGKSKPEYPWHSHSECKDQLRGLGESAKQVGEPSQRGFRLYEICEICCERKDRTEMFRNEGCRHRVCTDCISKHIQVKIESNSGMILCPGLDCRGVLAPERCKEFLPQRVVERWERTIIETMILDSEKFYCPFKDCSSMLLNDNAEGMMMMRESECPHCRRLFCVQCRVPWHSEMECREFQQLNADERGREDILLKKLAEEKKWKRCPICKFYVEKTEGCVHMTCRCGFEFCYRCGGKWSMEHGTCQM